MMPQLIFLVTMSSTVQVISDVASEDKLADVTVSKKRPDGTKGRVAC
jgi:hypothetical protein